MNNYSIASESRLREMKIANIKETAQKTAVIIRHPETEGSIGSMALSGIRICLTPATP